ncbi:MAG: RNA pyrophosphohydrolase [Alphaproteobacteria bacterium]|nr:RNA pyrophosphohydrolase [Alphaproteobacteria bacterium]
MSEKPFRPCVGLALLDSTGRALIGERIDTPNAWQMPQGGIDENEDIETAAFRELQEEVGLTQAHATILGIMPEKLRYSMPHHLTHLWDGKYAGQEQTWVALRFTGQDSDVKLDLHGQPEFSQWKWATLDDMLGLIVPFKRDTYTKVIGFLRAIA